MATMAAYQTFMRVYNDPEGEQIRGAFTPRAEYYTQLWQRYSNAIFDDSGEWSAYRSRYHLYRHTRSLYNPVRRLCDFYAGIVYPGYLTSDGQPLPDGTPTAIPLASDTPPQLVAAVGQLWQWSNWQTGKGLLPLYGAALGETLLEVIDDTERGKVRLAVVWPGLVTDLELDGYGNVKAYAKEYTYQENDTIYTYKIAIDADAIRTYRDGKPFAYSEAGAEYANPYGFVPACWCKHVDTGGDHGQPAVRNVATIDELNSLAAHALDQGHTILSAPVVIAGDNISALTANTKNDATDSLDTPTQRQESIKFLKAAAGAGVTTIRLDPGEAMAHIESLLNQVEADHPEITMYTKLREQTQVTGPGADRMFGDVRTLVDAARANYDTQLIKGQQMGVAIGGWRAQRGDWGPRALLTRQQQAFTPYDLDSYAAGALDMEIMPRPLVAPTERERLEIERLRAAAQAETMPQAATMAQGIADRLRAAGNGAPVAQGA